MAAPKKVHGGFPYLWTLIGFGAVAIIVYVFRFTPGTEAYEAQVKQDRLARLEELHKAAEEKLAPTYRWVDKEKQVVAIPVARAIELTIADLKAKGVTPSEVKAVTTGSLVVPPYLKPAEAAAPEGEAAPGEGEAAPAQGEATPQGQATPAAGEATPESSQTPEASQPTAEAAEPTTPAAPAAPEAEAPAEPTEEPVATPNASPAAPEPAAETVY